MEKVKVNKAELLAVLKDNRNKHKSLFDLAVEGYRKAVLEDLDQHMERVKKGSLERIVIVLPVPEDHTSDYDRVIKMCEMSIDDVLEVEEQEFSEYVMDSWSWKKQWLLSNTQYTSK